MPSCPSPATSECGQAIRQRRGDSGPEAPPWCLAPAVRRPGWRATRWRALTGTGARGMTEYGRRGSADTAPDGPETGCLVWRRWLVRYRELQRLTGIRLIVIWKETSRVRR